MIRRIRNDFAHESGPIEFDDARWRDRLDRLLERARSLIAKDPQAPVIATSRMGLRFTFVAEIGMMSHVIRMYRHLMLEGMSLRLVTGVEKPGHPPQDGEKK